LILVPVIVSVKGRRRWWREALLEKTIRDNKLRPGGHIRFIVGSRGRSVWEGERKGRWGKGGSTSIQTAWRHFIKEIT